ncbi:UvrD-helicase domain-containing protein [Nocardia asteroides]|uniref:UvrD-helicase domain-containing protein n=1 Tax=Nocardia asteroides TaxID=1824 RepID=UPI0037C4F478
MTGSRASVVDAKAALQASSYGTPQRISRYAAAEELLQLRMEGNAQAWQRARDELVELEDRLAELEITPAMIDRVAVLAVADAAAASGAPESPADSLGAAGSGEVAEQLWLDIVEEIIDETGPKSFVGGSVTPDEVGRIGRQLTRIAGSDPRRVAAVRAANKRARRALAERHGPDSVLVTSPFLLQAQVVREITTAAARSQSAATTSSEAGSGSSVEEEPEPVVAPPPAVAAAGEGTDPVPVEPPQLRTVVDAAVGAGFAVVHGVEPATSAYGLVAESPEGTRKLELAWLLRAGTYTLDRRQTVATVNGQSVSWLDIRRALKFLQDSSPQPTNSDPGVTSPLTAGNPADVQQQQPHAQQPVTQSTAVTVEEDHAASADPPAAAVPGPLWSYESVWRPIVHRPPLLVPSDLELPEVIDADYAQANGWLLDGRFTAPSAVEYTLRSRGVLAGHPTTVETTWVRTGRGWWRRNDTNDPAASPDLTVPESPSLPMPPLDDGTFLDTVVAQVLPAVPPWRHGGSAAHYDQYSTLHTKAVDKHVAQIVAAAAGDPRHIHHLAAIRMHANPVARRLLVEAIIDRAWTEAPIEPHDYAEIAAAVQQFGPGYSRSTGSESGAVRYPAEVITNRSASSDGIPLASRSVWQVASSYVARHRDEILEVSHALEQARWTDVSAAQAAAITRIEQRILRHLLAGRTQQARDLTYRMGHLPGTRARVQETNRIIDEHFLLDAPATAQRPVPLNGFPLVADATDRGWTVQHPATTHAAQILLRKTNDDGGRKALLLTWIDTDHGPVFSAEDSRGSIIDPVRGAHQRLKVSLADARSLVAPEIRGRQFDEVDGGLSQDQRVLLLAVEHRRTVTAALADPASAMPRLFDTDEKNLIGPVGAAALGYRPDWAGLLVRYDTGRDVFTLVHPDGALPEELTEITVSPAQVAALSKSLPKDLRLALDNVADPARVAELLHQALELTAPPQPLSATTPAAPVIEVTTGSVVEPRPASAGRGGEVAGGDRDTHTAAAAPTHLAPVGESSADPALAPVAFATSEPTMLPGEKFLPTAEQQRIYDAIAAGLTVKVQAGAGAGKTSTLEGAARRIGLADPTARIIYGVYNRSASDDATARMPRNVEVRTGHSIAFRWADAQLRNRAKPDKRDALRNFLDIGDHLSVSNPPVEDDKFTLHHAVAAALKAVDTYANSADDEVLAEHLPDPVRAATNGYGAAAADVEAYVLDIAQRIWRDMAAPDGSIRINPDHVRKLWALSRPDFTKPGSGLSRPATILFWDEAQDTPPVLARVLEEQPPELQRILVGDANQAIYGFTGAIDYLARARAEVELLLTESHRFGPAVADIANRFLQLADSPMRIVGAGKPSVVAATSQMSQPDAVLVRTNRGMVTAILAQLEAGRRVGVPAGTRTELQSIVATVRFLTGEQRWPPRLLNEDLAPYLTWKEVEEAAEDDPKLAMIVRLVDEHGTAGLAELLDNIEELDSSSNAHSLDVDPLAGMQTDLHGRTLMVTGRTWDAKDLLGKARFHYQPHPEGLLHTEGPQKGTPVKVWQFHGTPARRDAVLTHLKTLLAARKADREEQAPVDVVVTTAHKSKGGQWNRVQIGEDFPRPRLDPDSGELVLPPKDELYLLYVAVTRAQSELALGGLDWVLDHTDPNGGWSEDLSRDAASALTPGLAALDGGSDTALSADQRLLLYAVAASASGPALLAESLHRGGLGLFAVDDLSVSLPYEVRNRRPAWSGQTVTVEHGVLQLSGDGDTVRLDAGQFATAVAALQLQASFNADVHEVAGALWDDLRIEEIAADTSLGVYEAASITSSMTGSALAEPLGEQHSFVLFESSAQTVEM